MARAVRLAEAVFPPPHPNPRVGCVIVKDGRCIGEGAHSLAGMPHAEVEALSRCTESPAGATVYVTLEPCSHSGRTPPCVDALIEAGVKRVVIAHTDPSPHVAGQGVARLCQAGVEITLGLLEEDARALNQGYLWRTETGRPWVTVKLAASLDGGTALASGESRWITSTQARRDVHRQRAQSAAIMSSAATVRIDDPLLNVRLSPPLEEERQPLRVILDPRLEVSPKARVFSVAGPVLIIHGAGERHAASAGLEAAGAELERVDVDALGCISPAAVLNILGGRGINSVWMEAGPTLAGGWLNSGLVDELIVYLAPHLLGETARPLLRLGGLEDMDRRRGLEIDEVRRVGDEIRITARPR